MRLGFAAALAVLCLGPIAAQEPTEPPPERPDGDVVPAQFTEPPPFGTPPGLPPAGMVADPATPVVRVQVRVPAAVAPKSPVKYTFTLSNTSTAVAHRVKLRHAPPEGAGPPKFTPEPDNFKETPPPKVFTWDYPTLAPGVTRVVTAEYTPLDKVKQLRAEAFVSFEHGEAVVTQVEVPRLALRKSAPTTAMAGDKVRVRVEVANTGGVPVQKVELIETLPKEVEIFGEGEKTASPGQRVWKLGSLRPGERRVIDYEFVAKTPGDVLTSSAALGQDAVADGTKEAVVKVDVAGVKLGLVGPARVEAGGAGEYVATVVNSGTTPLTSVRVRASIPQGCRATAMSAGGRVGRDELVWDGPPDRDRGPLRAGEKFEVKFKLKGERAGDRTVRVVADAPRVPEQSAEAKTTFQGGSLLQGVADISPGVVAVGGEGRLNYKVTNQGDGIAKGVLVTVTIPPSVSVGKLPARARQAGNEIQFDATDLPPSGSAEYMLDFRGEKPSQALFEFKVSESGGARALTTTKEVAVTARK